jgi:hypothetical protein
VNPNVEPEPKPKPNPNPNPNPNPHQVRVVPRGWWKERAFSQGLADFSQPLVTVTDYFTGKIHAMR